MDRIVDLDIAAEEIDVRRAGWTADGLDAGPTTWRESAATGAWPYPILPDRQKLVDPDSVGVIVKSGDRGFMEIVLFRGGWADLTVGVYDDDREPIVGAPEIDTPQAFGVAIDNAVAELLRRLG